MARRPKAGDPELLLVSFCDIVTVTTSALFMAMVITIQEAMKVPVLKGTPIARTTFSQGGPDATGTGAAAPQQKVPVYFECREMQLFPVGLADLTARVRSLKLPTPEGATEDDRMVNQMKALSEVQITNDFYRVNPNFLLVGHIELLPKPDAPPGETEKEFAAPNSRFHTVLQLIDPKTHYAVFLVRDDSFALFRAARVEMKHEGYDAGWEYLGKNDPIKFSGLGGNQVLPQ